jgi:hypothetical protein
MLWLGTLWSIRSYEGWGAWAAAPLIIPSVLLSVLWGIAGLSLLGAHLARTRHVDAPLAQATLLGAVVFLYYVAFNLLREY